MKLAIYSTKQYDRKYLEIANRRFGASLEFFDFKLSEQTAKNAEGCNAVCIFVNDDGSRPVLEALAKVGVKLLALRCAGFNNVGHGRRSRAWASGCARSSLLTGSRR